MSLLNPANDVVRSPAKLIRAANGNINFAARIAGVDASNLDRNTVAARMNRKNFHNTLTLAAKQLREAADMLDEIREEGL